MFNRAATQIYATAFNITLLEISVIKQALTGIWQDIHYCKSVHQFHKSVGIFLDKHMMVEVLSSLGIDTLLGWLQIFL